MGIFDSIKEKKDGMGKSRVEKLLADTERLQAAFQSELKNMKLDTVDMTSAGLGNNTIDAIYDLIVDSYNNVRERDFDEYDKATSFVQDVDRLQAACAKVIEWHKTLVSAAAKVFGKFWDLGPKIEELESRNRNLITTEPAGQNSRILTENLSKLDAMLHTFRVLDKVTHETIEKIARDIQIGENNKSDEIRKSTVYVDLEGDDSQPQAEERDEE